MRALLFCMLLFCTSIQAAPWEFEPAISVTTDSATGVFTHLESSGRKSIAVADGWVAVAWEDNRDGVSRCYVAVKQAGHNKFSPSFQVSGNAEAAEPAIVGLSGGRFALAWEEAGQIRARVLTTTQQDALVKLSAPLQLSAATSTQASLSYSKDNGLFAVWSEHGKQYWQIRLAKLQVSGQGKINTSGLILVDAAGKGDQSYPSIAELAGDKTMVAWEDRRAGHTRILTATSNSVNAASFETKELNEYLWRGKNLGLGMGTGVMRVSLAAHGQDGVAAVWADKRDFPSGYDVYGSFARGPNLTFGANEKVQDEFGDTYAQWHPTVAANRDGRVAVVWDDDREGSPDVWLSWRNADGWSGDLAVPGASGAGVQSDPSIAMDELGNLHLVWVEKADLNSPSRIRYLFARAIVAK